MLDAEGAQSPPAAHSDDSLATNPSAGLVAEEHPPTRRRGGWGRAGVFAVAAWLAWLAWPTAAFAQATLTLRVDDDIAGDDTINIAEKANGFPISGNTGAESGVTVEVTIGTGMLSTTSVAGDWSVIVPLNASYITGTSVSLGVTATKTGFTSATPVSRTLKVDLTAPTVSYTAPLSLTVGDALIAMVPTKSEDIDSYAISGDSLLRGLSLNGATGVISGMPTTGNPNTQTVVVLATDDAGNTGTAMIDFPPVAGPEPGLTVDPPAEDLPPEGLSVPEGDSVQYTLVLDTEPTHEVAIEVRRASGDDSVTAAPTTLTFTTGNWYEEQTVTLSAAEDNDGNRGISNFAHNAVSDDSLYHGIDTPGVKTIEADNDSIGVKVSPTTLSVPEGGSATYTVRLGTEPLDDVTVEASRDQLSDRDLTVSSDTDTDTDTVTVTLAFTNSNWDRGQTVTVSAADDADEVDGVAIFSHTTASADDDYYEIDVDPVTATEADDDKDVIDKDVIKPTARIQTEAPALVGGPFEVTIRFSENVRGFTLRDIDVTNGTASNFNKVYSRRYTVTITPEESGEVRVEVRSNVARDGAGNGNRAAAPLTIEADLTAPEVEITSKATGPVGGAFEVTITFSEEVTDFEGSDIQVTNGTVSDFGGSGKNYTVEITPSASGEVSVEVGADAAEDGAGHGNRAAAPFVIEADLTGPEVTIEGPTEPVGMAEFEVTITFSEEVTGFEGSDIQVTNGTVNDFGGSGKSYTVEITPSGSGEVRVEVGADAARDGAGNGNRAAAPFIIEADLTPPEVEITSEAMGPVVGAFEVTITFSEAVTGFEGSDIHVTNGTVADFTEVTPSVYGATIELVVAGQVVVAEVPEDVVKDVAGNGNLVAAPFTMETAIEVSYAAESYTAAEGGEAVTVTVRLSLTGAEGLAIPIRVTRPETTEAGDYRVEGLEGWDAREGAGTLSFPAGEKERIWRIAANHDGDGDDETVELGFGDLPEIAMAGEPSVATVTLEDKGLVELQVRFAQAAYEVKEGEGAAIEVSVSPAADRRVEVPLLVALRGGTTAEDYRGVPASVVFGEGERAGTISVEVLADEVSDSGEGILLSFGALPEGVVTGDPSSTEVGFGQQRTAEQFTPSLEGMLAVMARSLGESAQTAIEGRFARYRQWSRLGSSDGALEPRAPGTDEAVSGSAPTSDRSGPVSRGESSGFGVGGAEGDLGGGDSRVAEDTLPAAGRTLPAMEPSGAAARDPGDLGGSWTGGSWLRNVLLGSLGRLARSDQLPGGTAAGSGIGRSRNGYGEAGLRGFGGGAPGLAGYSALLSRAFNLSGASFEVPLGERERETSWAPAFWGQGDLQQFDGDLAHLGMNYRGSLNAAHVGLDLYANEQVLAGLSFMRSWGDLDYTDDGVDGVMGNALNTVHPYLYWQPSDRVSVWGLGGLGRGQVDVTEPGRTHDFDADFRMFAGGVRAALLRRGGNEWSVRADAFTTRLETGAEEDIAKVGGEAHRGRMMLEWVYDRQLSVGRSLSLKGEAGGRFDRGAADLGAGVETGFRLGYLDANQGLDVGVQGRVLLVHESDYRDWGAALRASWDPGEKQRGFRASVRSSWGRDGGGRTTLWDNADVVMQPAGMGTVGMGARYRMESEVAYAGLKAPGVPGRLTPYSRLRWAAKSRELAWGASWPLPARSQLALPGTFELEGLRRETTMGPSDLALLVRMSIPF